MQLLYRYVRYDGRRAPIYPFIVLCKNDREKGLFIFPLGQKVKDNYYPTNCIRVL